MKLLPPREPKASPKTSVIVKLIESARDDRDAVAKIAGFLCETYNMEYKRAQLEAIDYVKAAKK